MGKPGKLAMPVTALLSGRFDPPHPGHICTILRLLKKFDKVLVVVLEYPERRFPLSYTKEVLAETLEDKPVEITSNTKHFGKISAEELSKFSFDVYVAGNLQVLRHIETLGVPVMYAARAYEYAASKIPI